MATIATQVFNEIEHLLKKHNEDIGKLYENWKAVAYVGSEYQWHIGWQCLPLGLEFTLLHCPSDDGPGILKHGKGWQEESPIEGITPYTYFSMKQFEEIAKAQNKNIIPYKSDLLQEFINYLPGSDQNTKAYYLGKMLTGSILGTTIGTGSYSSKYGKWDDHENHFALFLTSIQSLEAKNMTMVSGCLERAGLSEIRNERYPFAYFNNNCDENRFCPGIVYTQIKSK